MSNANMAKREFSSTLKNLKFMQRAAQREEMMVKKEEVKPEEPLTSPGSGVTRKCVVITEGDPHPGAVKGRLSFQNFNPSIDKLTEEASKPSQPSAPATSSAAGIGSDSLGENGPSTDGGECSNQSELKKESSGERKRKQSPAKAEPESPENDEQSPKKKRKSDKKGKKDKLDYNLLRRSNS